MLAVLAVVTIHVTSYAFGSYDTLQRGAWLVADMAFSATRWPVLVFVMLSGYLLLDRDEPLRTFYARRMPRVLVPLVAWSIAYWVFLELREPAGRDLWWFLRSLLEGGPYFHLYFLFVIAGLSLVTPFLRLVVRAGGPVLTAATVLALGYALVQRLLLEVHLSAGSNGLSVFIPYIGFYLLGSWLGSRTFSRPQIVLIAAVTMLVAAGTTLAAWLLEARFDGHWVGWIQAYFGPAGVVEAVGVFVMVRAVPHRLTDNAIVRWGGSVALGVYLLSPMVAATIGSVVPFPRGPAGAVRYIVVQTVVIALASATITSVMRRLPVVRSVV